MSVRIPLRAVRGEPVAHAVVDLVDSHLAERAWYRLSSGYAVRTEIREGRKRMLYLHREVVGVSLAPGLEVDHIDGDRLNCRRSNLRVGGHEMNAQNRGANRERDLPRNVYPVAGDRFKAQVKVAGTPVHLGVFDTVEEADAVASAYRAQVMPWSADARQAATVEERL